MPDTSLQAALVLPVILLAAWLPGWLALNYLGAPLTALRPLEKQFAALSLGLALLGWLAFLLAQLAIFSITLLALLWLLATGALALLNRAAPRQSASPPLPALGVPPLHRALEPIIILFWLPAALWLFLRPHEAILGAADAGVYVSTAAQIAQRGAILAGDPSLAQMDPALHAAVLRPIPDAAITPAYLFPGFNVASAAAGTVIPDFFHFHATWQAIAYGAGALWGGPAVALRAALLIPGLWALLGALAVYLTLHQVLEQRAAGPRQALLATLFAALALAALTLSAMQVWFARYPVAETLSQYLLWTGLWSLSAWLGQRQPLRLWAVLAALSLGLLLLTRIDMIFIMAIPLLTGAWHLSQRALRRAHLWFYLPFSLLVLHTVLHAAFISRPYFNRILRYGEQLLSRFWLPMLLAALLFLAIAWLLLRYGARVRRTALGRPLLALSALAILLLAAYAWFLRPVYGALPSYSEWYDGQTIVLTDRENLRRLGWYLSPFGVWLGVAGAMLLTWRANRRSLPLLAVGLFFSVLYIWRIQANPHQIYVMRRYVPVVLPFFITAAAYLLHTLAIPHLGLGRLGSRYKRLLRPLPLLFSLALALGWLGAIAWSARGFVTQTDYTGLADQLVALDRRLPPHSVLLFAAQSPITLGDTIGTPLHYVFGHDVYSLRNRQALDDDVLVKTIENWHNNGRAVYWIGAPEALETLDLNVEPLQFTIATNALEGSYDHKPYQIIPLTWTLNLNRIQP